MVCTNEANSCIKAKFSVIRDVLRFQGQICVPYDNSLRSRILVEAHSSLFVREIVRL